MNLKNNIFSGKKDRLKRLHSILFHLYETLKMAKLIYSNQKWIDGWLELESIQGEQEVWGE